MCNSHGQCEHSMAKRKKKIINCIHINARYRLTGPGNFRNAGLFLFRQRRRGKCGLTTQPVLADFFILHVDDGRFEFTQFKGRNKNPVRLKIRILEDLQRIIDASPVGDLTFLVTAFNKPFTANGFGNRFRKWCDEANLPQCSAHGLRKAAATRMAECGCSEHEIMAIGGWKTLKEVQRYTESAQQKLMADSGSVKLEAAQDKNKSV